MVDIRLFSALDADSVALDVTTTTGRVALTGGGTSVQVFNEGSDLIFVALGSGDIEAEVPADGAPGKGMPIPSGMVIVLAKGESTTHLAAITKSGTATVYATTGSGA